MAKARLNYSFDRVRAASWAFPDNQNGEIKGFNDAGVSTFGGRILRSIVRESIQNSLDAALKPRETPVLVEFELFQMSHFQLPGINELKYAFKQCRARAEKHDKAYRFFNQAIKHCDGLIPVLRISDHGTTGLRGAESGDLSSDWSRLVKQSGSSSKDDFSGGSFGIGKYATFACSAMRTVFFSSMDDSGIASSIGVARLTSFEDRGVITSGIGYYSDNESNNAILAPLNIPHALERSTSDPGTDIYIMDCVEPDRLMRTIEFEALASFLVSIWKGFLELDIGGKHINKRNLARVVGELNDEDDDERTIIEHFSLLSDGTEDVHRIILDPDEHSYADKFNYPRGSAVLFLKQGKKLNRSVMMTRSQGMKLFEQKGISGTIQFTGILMIEGERMNEDFREMEAPSHDKWEPDRARNRSEADRCYKGLRQWIRDEVVETFSHEAAEQIDAFNVGLYLPATSNVETTIKNRTPNRAKDAGGSLDRRSASARKRPMKPKEQTDSADDAIASNTQDAMSTATNKKSGKSNKQSTQASNPMLDGLSKMSIRARTMATSNHGIYRLKFVVPRDVSRFTLKIRCEGEVGASDLTVRSANVTRGEAHLIGIDGNCIGFGECRKGEVVELDLEPKFDRYCMLEVDFYATK